MNRDHFKSISLYTRALELCNYNGHKEGEAMGKIRKIDKLKEIRKHEKDWIRGIH